MLTGHYHGIRFSSICFRKSLLDGIVQSDPGFFNPLFSTLDIAFFYECAYHGIVRYIKESTMVYRIQKDSVSITSNPVKSAKFSMGCLEIYQHYFHKFSLPVDVIHVIFRHSANAPLMNILWNRDKDMARQLRKIAYGVGYKFSIGQSLILKSCTNIPLSLLLRVVVKVKSKFA